jgi:hypothetical protein
MRTLQYISLFLVFIIAIVSCRSNNSKNKSGAKEEISKLDSVKTQLNEIYYRFPSPDEMFRYIENKGLQFDNNLVLPIKDVEKFLDSKSQAVNLGVYTADLAYITLFQKYKESLDYFQVTYILAGKLRITSSFNDAFIKRVEKNLNNLDSLKVYSGEAYSIITSYLVQNDKEKVLAQISVGGFIESLYIALNLINDYSPDNITIQRIADQKLAFDNMLKYCEVYKDDPNIKELLNEIEPVRDIFDNLKIVKGETKTGRDKNGKLIISGGDRITITKEQYIELKKATGEIRNIITLNTNK